MSDLISKTDFPLNTFEEWRDSVEKGLRGKPFDTLLRKTEDAIVRGPLLRAEDLPPSLATLGRANAPLLEGRAWHIAAPVRGKNLGHANQQLLEDLNGGASAVRIEASLSLSNQSDFKRVLEGVYTDLVPIQFVPSALTTEMVQHLTELERLSSAVVWTGLDPVKTTKILLSAISSVKPKWRLLGVSPAQIIHEAGGTNVQEIAGMAAALAESMRIHGVSVTTQHMVIDLAAGCDTHLTIAKFRAARRIILRIAAAFGGDGSEIPLCAVTSQRMMQTEDAWTNLLRVMSAGFGAVLGGADMITTRPFTDGLGQATPFAHRIARNMQLMMMEESHLGQVSDIAFGSYWHETMTEQLAQAAWKEFQAIEAMGGMSTYQDSDQFKDDIGKSGQDRRTRNDPILGVTLHPAKDVKTPEVRL